MRQLRWLEDAAGDARYGLRLLAGSPVFAATAILSLALGIGANTAIFSLVDAVLLRTLPVERASELVFLQVAGTDSRGGAPPYPCYEQVRDGTSAFVGMAAFASDELRLEIDGNLEQAFGQVASGTYFELLGVRPLVGRLLTAADERLDPPVAVISYRYWQRRFGGRVDTIGRALRAGDRVFTIVGVTPPEFNGLLPGRQIEVTFPITQAGTLLGNADTWWFDAIARLRNDITPDQAAAQANAIFQAFMDGRPQAASREMRRRHFDRLELAPAGRGGDRLRTRFSRPLLVLTLISALVLLTACANLGNLLLARGTARRRELAIRLATGAGEGRLVRQLLTETLLLFLLGGAAGLIVARVATDAVTSFFTLGRTPILLDVGYDWRIAGYALAVTLAAALLTGLWPAVRARRVDLQSAMKDGDSRAHGAGRSRAASGLLVAGQVALSLVLLVSATLFGRTMLNLRAVDLGFSGTRVLTMSIDPMLAGEAPAHAREQIWRSVLDRVRALPGVRSASLSVLTPLSGRDTGRNVTVPGFQPQSERDRTVRLNHVSEDYFEAFGIQLASGRTFTARDAAGAAPVAVVNEAAARAYFAGRNPIGERVSFNASTYEIIGIVRDHKHRSLREEAARFVYIPIWQPLDRLTRTTLSVASDQASRAMTRAVAHEIRAVHARTLVSDVLDVQEQIDATLVSERLLSRLAGALAALAVGLVAIGLYGTLSYAVARRRSELGVRMALGASRRRVAGHVIYGGVLQVVAGIAAGLPLAVAAARLAEGLLYGTTAGAIGPYAVSVIALGAVGVAAAGIPAWRACSIDPADALRQQ
ncbi:MAG TPA: ABC transporter permease [Vicinamibacterales bacterium]|nr:ABC transporter permease [Vicinamibacterales bacterium]